MLTGEGQNPHKASNLHPKARLTWLVTKYLYRNIMQAIHLRYLHLVTKPHTDLKVPVLLGVANT